MTDSSFVPRPLPEKKYFKIGEVAVLVGVEPHVLRYWETQFPQLRPHKARSGHRLYRRREVQTLLVIRELLHVQRFTIAGARQALRQPGGATTLLPRFFDGPGSTAPRSGEHAALNAADDDAADADGADGADDSDAADLDDTLDGGVTLTPGRVDATDEDEADGLSDDGSLISVEAHGLDSAGLKDALERENAERLGRAHGGGVVEVEVEALEIPPAASRDSRAPRSERIERTERPRAPALAPNLAPLGMTRHQRALLEQALGEARSVLAILDREEAGARRLHV